MPPIWTGWWLHEYVHTSTNLYIYESSILPLVSYVSIKTKKNKREFVLTGRPSSLSGWTAICPPLSSAFHISEKLSLPVLSRLGYCNLEVPAAAVYITIFQLPPLFLKNIFKKISCWNTVQYCGKAAGLVQPAQTPSPPLVNKKPWVFLPYPQKSYKVQ